MPGFFRTWYLLVRISWWRILLAVICFPSLVMLYPAAYTPAEQIAAAESYRGGLTARLSDSVLWSKACISGVFFAGLMILIAPVFYYASIWLGAGRRPDRS